MTDIDELERLIKSSKQPAQPVSGATALALIAEVRALRKRVAAIEKATTFYDQLMGSVQGCTDGGCLIRRPQGMHTNGGCRCPRDAMKTQRVLYAAKHLRVAIGGAK